MLRVLWVTNEQPDRNLGGGSIRQAHLLEALAAHAQITLVLFGLTLDDPITRAALTNLIELPDVRVRLPRSKLHRRVHDLLAVMTDEHPPEVEDYRHIRAALAERWSSFGEFDVVLIEHAGLAPLIELRRDETWLLTMHNVGSGTLAQLAATTAGRRRWIYQRQADQARRFEAWALETFDQVFSVSDEDADLLPRSTTVIANGVDLSRFTPTQRAPEPRLVLVGTFNYLPNVDGASWFVTQVFPLIQTQVPGVTLDLVGRRPVRQVSELADHPGVNLHADVPDVREYLSRARVCLVPLRIGTGTRLKALEAFAAHRPVVGTTVGLSGLGVINGVHALVADEPRAFADCVITALSDDAVADRVANEAYRLVQQRYSWVQISSQFVDAVLSGHD